MNEANPVKSDDGQTESDNHSENMEENGGRHRHAEKPVMGPMEQLSWRDDGMY